MCTAPSDKFKNGEITLTVFQNHIKGCEHTVCINKPREEWLHNTGSLETGTTSKEYTAQGYEDKRLRTGK